MAVEIKNSSTRDDILFKAAEAASKWIDRWTHRTFRTLISDVIQTPEWNDLLIIPDLLALSSIAVDYNLDGVYETVLDNTADYYLEPVNAPMENLPYTKVRRRNVHMLNLGLGFPVNYQNSVKLSGTWGYYTELSDTGVTASSVNTSATTVTVSSVGSVHVGWTIIIDSEQMFVTARSSDAATSGTITVIRGMNGTTAAVHGNVAPISRYVYPIDIEMACMQIASRTYRRIASPLGMVNVPGDIGRNAINIPKSDPDVIEKLKPFKRRDSIGAYSPNGYGMLYGLDRSHL